MKKLPLFAIIVISLLSLAGSCSKEVSGHSAKPVDSFNLVIYFKPVADSGKLRFDSTYTNFWKEKYSVSTGSRPLAPTSATPS